MFSSQDSRLYTASVDAESQAAGWKEWTSPSEGARGACNTCPPEEAKKSLKKIQEWDVASVLLTSTRHIWLVHFAKEVSSLSMHLLKKNISPQAQGNTTSGRRLLSLAGIQTCWCQKGCGFMPDVWLFACFMFDGTVCQSHGHGTAVS